uniref:Premelanosome protein b n=1 Tax=Eptatretus burgeri TaxID=7764 RepID=A0A8C4QRH9_EPTBU
MDQWLDHLVRLTGSHWNSIYKTQILTVIYSSKPHCLDELWDSNTHAFPEITQQQLHVFNELENRIERSYYEILQLSRILTIGTLIFLRLQIGCSFVRFCSFAVSLSIHPSYLNCVKGGRVTVDLRNDGPTMTGANASFTARLHFPGGQCESSEGDVVWPSMAKNTGKQGGASVYPELGEQGLKDASVPPGGRRRRRFVYVWSTRGQQWQQFGRASSKFSLSSDNFALGSYMMVLVVYHHRKSQQYIPIAKASTIYSITDQIPVTVEMRQAQDRLPGDNRFVTGASIEFAANIHDPRRFLAQADLTYTWEFGDESGTLIARVPSATHDYSVPGTYLPRLVVQATISRPCPLTQSPTTTGPRTFPSSPSQGSRSIITASSEILTTFDPTSQRPALGNMTIMTTAVVLTYNTASSENLTETSFSTTTFDNETTMFATTMNTTDAPAALVLVKRQAPENSECPIYLYGTYRASIDLIGYVYICVCIHNSIPTKVCTTVADNDCSSPHGQWCRPVPHQADCAIHLQELFNSTGSYCLNVTLVNSQSLALASTEVLSKGNISAGMIVGIVIIAGFLLVVLAFTIHR